MKFLALALALTTFTNTVFACSQDGKSGILPKNDMYIPAGMKSINGLTERVYDDVITKVETLYAPIVANLGGKLVMNSSWENGEVNAYASRDGNVWNVIMTGGLARHSAITADGLALVVCHELGHHIGGAPKKVKGNPWAGTEGQSDYFATLKCLRQVFLNDNNAQIVKSLNAPSNLVDVCKRNRNAAERNICIRSAMAGVSVANLFASMQRQEPSQFHTPDTNVVTETYEGHPATQCRLDTYLQGALCGKSHNEDVSQSDEVVGTCHRSTNHRIGLRPSCWFKSK